MCRCDTTLKQGIYLEWYSWGGVYYDGNMTAGRLFSPEDLRGFLASVPPRFKYTCDVYGDTVMSTSEASQEFSLAAEQTALLNCGRWELDV